jgi:hypothetical protein
MRVMGLEHTSHPRLLLLASIGLYSDEKFAVPEAFFNLAAVCPFFGCHGLDSTDELRQKSMSLSVQVQLGKSLAASEHGYMFVGKTCCIEGSHRSR